LTWAGLAPLREKKSREEMVPSSLTLELEKIAQAIQNIKDIIDHHGSSGGGSAKIQAVLKTLKGQDKGGITLLCANVATALEAYF
jgi:hypothetical protein